MLQMKTQRINCWEADVKGFTNAVGAGMRRNGLLLIALQWDRNRGVKLPPPAHAPHLHPCRRSIYFTNPAGS